MSGELVVRADVVQLLRNVGAGPAWVDVLQGEPVGDIDDETRARLLASGAIGPAPVELASEPDPDPDEVPDGPVADVLAWVGDDLERAQRALDVEQADGGKNRKGVVDPLTELLTRPE